MADPKYVRLTDRMSGRTIADITGGSRWSISGAEVKPFPKDKPSGRYVRRQLAAGILEGASKAELDDLKKSSERYEQTVASAEVGHQEEAIQEAAEAARQERLEGQEADDDAEGDD